MNDVRLIDANAFKKAVAEFHQKQKELVNNPSLESISVKNINKLIDNAPTVKTYCYYCGQTKHGKISENDITDFYPKIIRSTKESAFDDYLKEQMKDPEFREEYMKASEEIKIRGEEQ